MTVTSDMGCTQRAPVKDWLWMGLAEPGERLISTCLVGRVVKSPMERGKGGTAFLKVGAC